MSCDKCVKLRKRIVLLEAKTKFWELEAEYQSDIVIEKDEETDVCIEIARKALTNIHQHTTSDESLDIRTIAFKAIQEIGGWLE